MPTPDPNPTAADSAPGGTPPAADTASFHDPAAPYPFLAPPQAADEVGRLGKYRVLGVLGKGGMGAVFRAEEPALRRLVALKVMLPQFAGNELAKARFLREARAAAAVEHDHILPILTVDEDGGVPFIAMPLLKGMPLSDALKAARPPLAEALRVGREMAEGLAAAHEKGLVHRDIKPANVWLEGSRRRVKILDFGLARAAEGGGDSPDDPATESGAVIGTPAYMSVEQASGRPVDARTDLWSLGVVLYEMTTGTRPFTGPTTMAILSALALHTPPPADALAPDCPPDLARLIAALLEKEPARRPGSAAWVAEELARIEQSLSAGMTQPVPLAEAADDPWAALVVTDPGMTAAPVALATAADRPVGAGPPARRKPPLTWAVAGAAVLAAAGVGVVLALKGSKPTDDTPADTRPVAAAPRATGKGGKPRHAGPDYALQFDGVSGVVTIPTLSRNADEPFTVEAYVTPARIARKSDYMNVVHFGGAFRSQLVLYGTRWREATARGTGSYSTASPLEATAGQRTHVAVVHDKTTKLYVGGVFKRYNSGKQSEPSSPPGTTFGGRSGVGDAAYGSPDFFAGLIDEVRISRSARYADDFSPPTRFDPDPDTLALYHCDEGTGDVLRDSSGNNHHGTIAGAKWVTAAGADIPLAPDRTFFNGKDLTGWEGRTYGWRVEGGRLIGQRVGALPARINTVQSYRDYELSFRITSAGGDNSDAAAFSTGVRLKANDIDAPAPGGRHVNVFFRTSDVVIAHHRDPLPVKPGQPIDMSIRCIGSGLRVLVNGVVLADGSAKIAPEGAISWSPARTGETVIENIRFTDLSRPAADPPK